jgi:hypothetical protein
MACYVHENWTAEHKAVIHVDNCGFVIMEKAVTRPDIEFDTEFVSFTPGGN